MNSGEKMDFMYWQRLGKRHTLSLGGLALRVKPRSCPCREFVPWRNVFVSGNRDRGKSQSEVSYQPSAIGFSLNATFHLRSSLTSDFRSLPPAADQAKTSVLPHEHEKGARLPTTLFRKPQGSLREFTPQGFRGAALMVRIPHASTELAEVHDPERSRRVIGRRWVAAMRPRGMWSNTPSFPEPPVSHVSPSSSHAPFSLKRNVFSFVRALLYALCCLPQRPVPFAPEQRIH